MNDASIAEWLSSVGIEWEVAEEKINQTFEDGITAAFRRVLKPLGDKDRGESTTQLAERIGVPRSTLFRIAKPDSNPNLKMAGQIATATDTAFPTPCEAVLIGTTTALNWLAAEAGITSEPIACVEVAVLSVLAESPALMADAWRKEKSCVVPIAKRVTRLIQGMELDLVIDKRIDLELIHHVATELYEPWVVIERLCKYDWIEP